MLKITLTAIIAAYTILDVALLVKLTIWLRDEQYDDQFYTRTKEEKEHRRKIALLILSGPFALLIVTIPYVFTAIKNTIGAVAKELRKD